MNPSEIAKRPPFKPTPEMIAAAENLFLAMTIEQTVRPIVEGYERKIVAERSWRYAPNIMERMERRSPDVPVEQYVTDIRSAWMMEQSDFLLYIQRCKEERDAAGLVVEDDSYCPLLVAENTTRRAQYALCGAMSVVTNIAAATVVTLKRADRDKFVDLSLRLLAPFVTNPLAQYTA